MRKYFFRTRDAVRGGSTHPEPHEDELQPPVPSPGYRRRAWLEFQRALDPLAAPKPLRERRRV